MRTTVVALFALAAAVPTASAAISYNGGLESGGYQPWSLQYEEDRPIGDSFSLVTDNVRQGKYAAKMIVRQGYSRFGYGEDTELEWDSNESEGSDYYYAWSTMFPTDWVAPAAWGIFMQWHARLGTSPPLNFNARQDSVSVSIGSGLTNEATNTFEYSKQFEILSTLSKGKWNDFVVHVRWSASPHGQIEIWHRVAGQSGFTKLATLNDIPTMQRTADKGTATNYTLWGLYRGSYCPQPTQLGCTSSRGTQPDNVLYQDGFTRGQSFDEVAKAAFGSAPAPAPAPDPTPTPTPTPNPAPEQSLASFTGVTDQGCAACRVDLGAGSVQARIGGGADGSDTAHGIADFGGTAGSTGRVFARTVLGLGKGQTLAANLAVLQMRAVDGSILYELYVGSDRTLHLWSTGGAMRASSINESAGVVVPNDGSSIRVEVSALANNSIVVRVGGIDKLTVSNLTGATGGKPRYLVAGIDHYDTTTTNEPVAVAQSAVGVSGTGWLGAPSTAPVVAPANTTVPRLTGSAIVGQTLSADTGTWSGSPTGTTTQWQRCTTAGSCSAIAGATGTTYAVASGDVGSTLDASVTATNAGGSTTAASAASAVVAAATVPTVPNLAPTPDYEIDPRSSYYALGTGTFTWATDAAHSGTHSLKIVSSQSAGSLARWLTLKAIPATAGRTYSVSAWLKTANTTGSAGVALNFWSSAGIYLGTWWSSDLTGSQAWTKLNVAATAPAGTASVRVEYRLTGPGTLWADDLTLNG